MRNTSGTSLIEALAGLVLLELIAAFTLSAALSARRTLRHIAQGGATDVARLEAIRHATASPACRNGPPRVHPIALPATPERPPLTVNIRCGR